MWFKNLRIFRLSQAWSYTPDELESALETHSFQPGTSQDPVSVGWIAPREGGPLVHNLNGQLLISVRSEKKLLPATVINQVTRVKARDIEDEQGYKQGVSRFVKSKSKSLPSSCPEPLVFIATPKSGLTPKTTG